MNIKQFLNPDWRKIVVFAITLVFMFLYVYNCYPPYSSGICEARGFSLIYYNYHTVSKMPPEGETSIFYLELIIDLITWYLLSCIIVFIYDKFKCIKTEK